MHSSKYDFRLLLVSSTSNDRKIRVDLTNFLLLCMFLQHKKRRQVNAANHAVFDDISRSITITF